MVRLFIHYAVSVDVRSGQSEHRLFGFLSAERAAAVPSVDRCAGCEHHDRTGDHGRATVRTTCAWRSSNGDELVLKSMKGIGPKLAQRIVRELRGRLAGGRQAQTRADGRGGQ